MILPPEPTNTEQWLRDVVAMKDRGMTPALDKQRMLDCADEIDELRKAAMTMFVALRSVEAEMRAVFGPNDFTSTREKVRNAILAGEEIGL